MHLATRAPRHAGSRSMCDLPACPTAQIAPISHVAQLGVAAAWSGQRRTRGGACSRLRKLRRSFCWGFATAGGAPGLTNVDVEEQGVQTSAFPSAAAGEVEAGPTSCEQHRSCTEEVGSKQEHRDVGARTLARQIASRSAASRMSRAWAKHRERQRGRTRHPLSAAAASSGRACT